MDLQNQDARKLFPGAVSHRTPQQSMQLLPQHQQPQLPHLPQQHQMLYNVNHQQTAPCVTTSSHQQNSSLSVYHTNDATSTTSITTPATNCSPTLNSIPLHCQQQSTLPINASLHQQPLPGMGPVNIDLGMLKCIVK